MLSWQHTDNVFRKGFEVCKMFGTAQSDLGQEHTSLRRTETLIRLE